MRSTMLIGLAWLAVTVAGPMHRGDMAEAPTEVKRMAMAGFMAAARAIQASDSANHRPALVPAYELTALGRGRLAVYRVLNIPGSRLVPLLVGFDGTRAIPLGGFQAPDLLSAASAVGLTLGRDRDEDAVAAGWLARIADPFGAAGTEMGEMQVYQSEVADTFAGLSGEATGSTVCVMVRSLMGNWVTAEHHLQYCFQADNDGHLVAWTRREL